MGILLSWTNLADAAGVNLTVDSEAQGLGLRAILTPQVADVYRSLPWGATTITLRVDLAAIRTINAIVLAAPRDGLLPSTGASVRVTADAALPDGNAALDTVVLGAHNLLLHSAAFTTTWIPNNATVLPGAGIGPDGTMSATGIADTTGNTQHWVHQLTTPEAATAYTFSLYARQATATSVTLRPIFADASYNSICVFNLALGTATITTPGMIVGTSIQDAGGGWWRCAVTILTPATPSSPTLNLRIQAGTGVYVGTGNTQFLIWGAQFERSMAASTYIATTTEPMSETQALGPSMARFGVWGWAGTSIQARYLRLRFTGTAADAYLQLGRLWIGPALITTRQAAYGFSLGAQDPGSNARASLTGVRDVQRGRPYRSLTWTADAMTTPEAAEVQQAALVAGTTGQVLLARVHDDIAATGCLGVFTRPPAPTRVNHALWRTEFAIEEDL